MLPIAIATSDGVACVATMFFFVTSPVTTSSILTIVESISHSWSTAKNFARLLALPII